MSGSCRKMLRSECGERQTDFRVYLNLIDAVELIFDRVFGGDDLGGIVCEFPRARYTAWWFFRSRSGRSPARCRAAWSINWWNVLYIVLFHAELLEFELHRALVEDTHDDAFAMDHRNDRHAHVDLAAAHLQLDAAVLRQPFFGDVQAAT